MRFSYLKIFFLFSMVFVSGKCDGQMPYTGGDVIINGSTIKYAKKTAYRRYYRTDHRIPLEKDFLRERTVEVPLPVTLNGEKIYSDDPYNPLVVGGLGKTFVSYLFYNLREEFSKLDDGDYELTVDQIVFDKYGKMVYYDTVYCCIAPLNYRLPIPNALRREIKDKVILLMHGVVVLPPIVDHKEVPFVLLEPFIEKTIVVKNHFVEFL